MARGLSQGRPAAPWDELALSAMAAAERAGPAMVLSHAAAAAVLGMQVLTFDHRTVEFTRDGNRGGGKEGAGGCTGDDWIPRTSPS
ncbi:hypothetical protein MTP03_41380 [Tsukamurella sp. PLM1]|nr:hypothetical protein MTP03_41380 [Tsukamurella sp. PLM1]